MPPSTTITMPEANHPTVVSIPITPALPKAHRLKRKQRSNSKVIGKIGFFIVILMILVLFVAIHSRQNEMFYFVLVIVFLVIVFISVTYWIHFANRRDGIWNYIGKPNSQHQQQVSNSNYHFRSVPNYKGHPNSQVHVVQPPKMGGFRLEIYTLSDDDQLQNVSHLETSSDDQGRHFRHPNSKSSRHQHHHHRHHHRKKYPDINTNRVLEKSIITSTACLHSDRNDANRASYDGVIFNANRINNGFVQEQHAVASSFRQLLATPPLRSGQSCVNLPICMDGEDENELEPIKVEVNLSRSSSHQYRRRMREGFEEVQLPPLKH